MVAGRDLPALLVGYWFGFNSFINRLEMSVVYKEKILGWEGGGVFHMRLETHTVLQLPPEEWQEP